MKKTTFFIIMMLMFSMFFFSPTVSAFNREVHDFDRIWYNQENGFNKNGDGALILAVTYTNNTLRTIDYCNISFSKSPFYFCICFHDILDVMYDDEGNIVYQEPSDGYIYLRKQVVKSFFPDDLKRFASKNLKYSTVVYNGDVWYQIHVPSFNRCYEWKEYNTPVLGETWYTWGCNNSVRFQSKAMYVKLQTMRMGSLLFDFSHPSNNDGQIVMINKSYLSTQGIVDPFFEWGDKKTWKHISYTQDEEFYYIFPEHFSLVGVHETASGDISVGFVDSNLSSDGDSWLLNTTLTGSLFEQQTTYDPGPLGGTLWQKFEEPDSFMLTKVDLYLNAVSGASRWVKIQDENGASDYVYKTRSIPFGNAWITFDIDNIVLKPGVTYRIYTGGANSYWYYDNTNVYPNGTCSLGSGKDFTFKLYGYWISGTRASGGTSERNIVVDTVSMSLSTVNTTVIVVPVSSSVQAITEVLNQTTMETASMVNSTTELVNNTYYYDSANQFVYIGIQNLTSGQTINWSVNCSYGSEFSISIPTYKDVGDDIFLQGVIKDSDGDGIDGVMASTYVYYQNGSVAIGAVEWNCTGGNFHTTISTTSLRPGIYSISVEFTDPVSGIVFKTGSVLYLSYPTGTGVYTDAIVFINFYNTNEGLGLPRETLKIYVDSIRQYDNKIYTYTGATINLTIKDYYNATLYTDNISISYSFEFIDLGLTFHEYDFTNYNSEYYIIGFLKNGATRWFERIIPSIGHEEFLLPTGVYEIRVYNADNSSYVNWSETVNRSKGYTIDGYNISQVIEGQSVIEGQILQFRNETYNWITDIDETLDDALMPDTVVYSRNPPIVFSCFDRIGMMLGMNYYKICPPINVIAQTRTEYTGNWINSTPMVPSNGTTENGSITILEDIVYFQITNGTAPTWVNITYMDNGTVIQNTTYLPNRFYPEGYNITINASTDIHITREIRFNQLKKFYWDYYPGTDNPGWLTENGQKRSGYHRAGWEITNTMNQIWYDVYVYAGLSTETQPDLSTVRVTDVDNGNRILDEGENYRVGGNSIEFKLTGCLNISETRNFLGEYYSDYDDQYYYGNDVIHIDAYQTGKRHDGKLYNYFEYTWINTYDKTYRGSLSFYFDFEVITGIKQNEIVVYDANNHRNITDFIVSDQFLMIGTNSVGDIAPGGGKTYNVYFKFETQPGSNVDTLHLATPLAGTPISMFIILVGLGLVMIFYGFFLMLRKGENKKTKKLGETLTFVGLLLTALIWILYVFEV